jgi:predicted nucleotidyltransferase
MTTLTRQAIVEALTKLGDLAQVQGHSIELVVIGGAAMVLLYNARPATRDVDVIILAPPQTNLVRVLAGQVAVEQELPDDWLNDGAKGFLVGVSEGEIVFSAPGIVVRTPAVAQLLAMKLSAWRDDIDIADAQQLLQHMNGEQDRIWAEVVPYVVPGTELKAQYAFMDLWEVVYDSD